MESFHKSFYQRDPPRQALRNFFCSAFYIQGEKSWISEDQERLLNGYVNKHEAVS